MKQEPKLLPIYMFTTANKRSKTERDKCHYFLQKRSTQSDVPKQSPCHSQTSKLVLPQAWKQQNELTDISDCSIYACILFHVFGSTAYT